MRYKETAFSDLLGLTLTAIDHDDTKITFITDKGLRFRLRHDQDCCEQVFVESIVGDLSDLLFREILQAEEVQNPDDAPDSHDSISDYDSSTWTFYKLATIGGYVTIRWLGISTGYYSERVSFYQLLN